MRSVVITRADGWKQLELSEFNEAEQKDASGHVRYFTETFNALAADAPLPVPAEKAYHNLAIIESARKATTERRAIEIPVTIKYLSFVWKGLV